MSVKISEGGPWISARVLANMASLPAHDTAQGDDEDKVGSLPSFKKPSRQIRRKRHSEPPASTSYKQRPGSTIEDRPKKRRRLSVGNGDPRSSPLARSNTAPAPPHDEVLGTPPRSAKFKPREETIYSSNRNSNRDLTSPGLHIAATATTEKPSLAAMIAANIDKLIEDPESSPSKTSSPPNVYDSKNSSPLSSPISTPSPPTKRKSPSAFEQAPLLSDKQAPEPTKQPSPSTTHASLPPAPQPTKPASSPATKQTSPPSKQPSPPANKPPFAKPRQPPQQPQLPGTNRQTSSTTNTARKRRTTNYELECTHTDICTCAMHAAHPTAQTRQPGNVEKGCYPHWSEWALGAKEWPESSVRNTVGRGKA